MQGTLVLDNIATIEVETQALENRTLKKGDLINEKSGWSETQAVGRVVLFGIDEDTYSFSNFTARLRLNNDNILPKYLHTVLNYIYQQGWTFDYQTGLSGLKNLDMVRYLLIKIPVPPLEVQNKIVAEIVEIENLESANTSKISKLIDEKIKQSYFVYPQERVDKLSRMLQRGKSANTEIPKYSS